MVLAELPESQHDPDDVRGLADRILSRSEYREPGESLLERLDRFFTESIESLLSFVGIGVSGRVASLVAWATLCLLIAVLIALVARAWRGGGWGRRGRERDASPIPTTESPRDAAGWLAEAERHEVEGRWREGVLCRYRALVTELVASGVLSDAAGRTAGEYVRDVARRVGNFGSVAERFAAATELFEAVYYGGAQTGPAQRDRLATLASATLTSLPAASSTEAATPTAPERPDAAVGPR